MVTPDPDTAQESACIWLGRISAVQGVRGWLKVFSDTEPREQIFNYPRWHLLQRGKMSRMEPLEWKRSGKTLIVRFAGIESRDEAQAWVGAQVGVPAAELPKPDEGEYYWFQLEGLEAWSSGPDGQPVKLGQVDHLFETGANDVLVIRPTPDSMDDRERLVPWSLGRTVRTVDLEGGRIELDWDPEF